jgi:hypothetical protein
VIRLKLLEKEPNVRLSRFDLLKHVNEAKKMAMVTLQRRNSAYQTKARNKRKQTIQKGTIPTEGTGTLVVVELLHLLPTIKQCNSKAKMMKMVTL